MLVSDKMTQYEDNLPEVVFALLKNFANNIIKILLSDPSAVQECRRYVAGIMTGRVHKEENITELVFTLKNNMQSYQVLCRVKIVKIQSQIQRNFQRKTEPKTEINPLFWAKNRDETNGTFNDDILS